MLVVALWSAGAAEAAGFSQAPGSPFAAGASGALALGDLNGDGSADALVADAAGGKLAILVGNGRGALAPAAVPSIATGGTKPSGVALADMNGDGRLDAVASNDGSKNVSVLLGDGGGGFAPAAKSPFATGGPRPASVTIADFNGDSNADVAAVNSSSADVAVLLGDGKGALTRAAGSPFSTGGSQPGPAAAGDFNGDGKLDLAVANRSGNLRLMIGDGAGKLSRGGTSPFGLSPAAIAAGDFNGDSKLDVAVANTTGTVSILLGTAAGGLTPAATPPSAAGTTLSALVAADLDNDGRLDLALADSATGNAIVLLGDGAAGFTPAPGVPVPTGGGTPSALAIADMNGDAKPDLAIVNAAAATISVLLNAVVAPPAAFVTFPAAPVAGEQVTFAYSSPGAIESLDWDLNGDGAFDDAHGPTAVQTFATTGTYAVGLRVTDLDGLVSTVTRSISVGAPPGAASPIFAPVTVATAPKLMAPFPIVRVTGRTGRRGARIKQLAVIAPAGAKVSVRCRGKGCPFAKWSGTVGAKMLTVGKLRGRFLRAGATLEVRVYKSREIGKYTKLVIERRRPPARSDLCLAPGSSAASLCPAT